MTREDNKKHFPDATDDQISALLDINSKDIGKHKTAAETAQTKAEEAETNAETAATAAQAAADAAAAAAAAEPKAPTTEELLAQILEEIKNK